MFRMRSRLLAGLLCAVLAAALIVPASAHGCHGGRSRGHHGGYRQNVQTTVTVCPYPNCTVTGRHLHSGVIYCGYAHEGGVCDGACRALCPYGDCDTAGQHTHCGRSYCGYDHDCGFCDGTCRALCPYEDCTLTGRHTHDGAAYCGDAHDCGFCDSSCHGAAVST